MSPKGRNSDGIDREEPPDKPVLPNLTSDESEPGWGDEAGLIPGSDDPDDLERFLRDVPPHHGD